MILPYKSDAASVAERQQIPQHLDPVWGTLAPQGTFKHRADWSLQGSQHQVYLRSRFRRTLSTVSKILPSQSHPELVLYTHV
jgi:hypothetical protein